MSSQKQVENSTQPSEVAKFYREKSIFVTGAAGFLGLVLLETLLRCCPDIRRIYILLRSKKGVEPEERKEIILKHEIFYKIKEKNPDVLKKVVAVAGDVSLENLGMSEDNLMKVTQEVSIIFHCAAAITFLKPLSFMMQQNVLATYNVIELCRKLKKLDSLVYTSTLYSNCNQTFIKEKVYEMPFTAEEALSLTRDGNEMELNCLFKKCNPQFPNFYTFSKCVAENLLVEKAHDLPVSIIRPAIIIYSLRGVLPGFIEYGSGLVSLCVGIGKGFIRVIRMDPEKMMSIVPVDIAANSHVLAASQVSERLPTPVVYNCSYNYLNWGDFVNMLLNFALKYPLPRCFQRPSITMCKGAVNYWILSVFNHYIPASVFDLLLWIAGRKLRLLKLYRTYDRSIEAMKPFTTNEWEFQKKNFLSLSEKLNDVDSEMFSIEMTFQDIYDTVDNLHSNSPMYRRNKDDKPYEVRKRLTNLRYFLTSFIKWAALGGIASAVYVAVF